MTGGSSAHEAVRRSDIKVLYILGIYRSGTTILSNLVGQLNGFFCPGELRAIWRELASPDGRCGCGEALRRCHVWTSILSQAIGSDGVTKTLAQQMQQWQGNTLLESHTWRRVPYLLLRGRQELARGGDLAKYGARLVKLYEGIIETTGARVIVDSSKEPSDAALLRLLPGIAPYFVHIVRDPRGTAYSSLRLQTPDRRVKGTHCRKSAYIASSWILGNLARSAVRRAHPSSRSLFLRYEDFVADPTGTLDAITEMVGEPTGRQFIKDQTATFDPTHTVAGNQNRFRTGPVRLQQDTEWMSQLHPIDRTTVAALSYPLLSLYGYPLFAEAPGESPSAAKTRRPRLRG